MNEMDVNRILAEQKMGWKEIGDDPFRLHVPNGGFLHQGIPEKFTGGFAHRRWNPFENRNDLSEVLVKLPNKQWREAYTLLVDVAVDIGIHVAFELLTCHPSHIAEAVAKVVSGEGGGN